MTSQSAAPATVRETERKYEAPAGAELPDWRAVRGVAKADGPVQTELDATYFDTADLRLLDAGFTLRRRTGGEDAGWHAKVPVGPGTRDELRLPLSDVTDGVPEALAHVVRGITMNAPLVEVARLKTTRTEWTLRNKSGAPLALVASDQVTAVAAQLPGHAGATARSWREVEVELAEAGSAKVADRLDRAMTDAGFPVASSASKLARALGTKKQADLALSTAGDVVMAYLRTQVDALRKHDVGIRRQAPDAVHQSRVACRKLRATLRTFRRVLDRDEVEQLRADLRWYARKLGPARDTEVLAGHLRAEVDAVPVEQVLGPVKAHLTAHFAREEAIAADAVARTMSADRYFRMLAGLDRLLRKPPLRKRAAGEPGKVLRKPVLKAWRRVDRSVRRAQALPEGEERHDALHQARKDAKKSRYAADAVRPAFGPKVRLWRKWVKSVQDALGEHHDAVVAAHELRLLGIREYAGGGNAFTHGLLHARQDEHARTALEDFEARWRKPPAKKKLPRWLRP